MVSEFIDPVYRMQREDVIDNVFYDLESSIIKNIPLCHSIQDDILIWPFTLDGEQSVKSRYKFLQEESILHQLGPATSDFLKPMWKIIWSLQVLGKVKKTWCGKHARTHCLPKRIRSDVKSSPTACVISTNNTIRMLSMPYIATLYRKLFGTKLQYGTTVHSSKVLPSLTLLISSMQEVGNLNYSPVSFGLRGIVTIIFDQENLFFPLTKCWNILRNEGLSPSLALQPPQSTRANQQPRGLLLNLTGTK